MTQLQKQWSPKFLQLLKIDFLNGHIVKLGKRYGITTPYNESVYALVKMMESQIK
jgi:2-dehydropantoate 2-reductase